MPKPLRPVICWRVFGRRSAVVAIAAFFSVVLSGCGSGYATGANPLSFANTYLDSGEASLTGDVHPIRDPSIIFFKANATYYVYSTDTKTAPWPGKLRFFCSRDRLAWKYCGSVFDVLPAWIQKNYPDVTRLWGPDISYFGGLYHLYYSVSSPGTQNSAIALATNTTLDPADPEYRWVDRGPVLTSRSGDDFNAIDPDILQYQGRVWMTYGSYWTGIKQREMDPYSGHLSTKNTARYDVAARPGVLGHPIEGASLVRHGTYFYLFVSIDVCCDTVLTKNNYKIAVGRGTSPNGPFFDTADTAMQLGGGTVLLQGDGVNWAGVGGQSLYIDPDTNQTLLAYQAQNMNNGGSPSLRVRVVTWEDDWPVIQ